MNSETLRRHDEQTDVINKEKNSNVDCGLRNLRWCTGEWCQKLGKIKVFLTVFAISLFLQGAIQTYFRISVKQAALDHGFDSNLTDWLLVTNGIFQGILAILITYLYQKFHPMSWIGGLIIFQSVAIILAIIPTLTYYPYELQTSPPTIDLCDNELKLNKITEERQYTMTTLVMLFILQFVISLTNIALYVIGLIYIDDNSKSRDFPIYAGIVLGCYYWGAQFGSVISIGISITKFSWWLGWAILSPIIFIIGLIICLFPKKLFHTVLKEQIIRNSQMNILTTNMENFIEDFSFFPTIMRLIRNKILLLNIFALVLIQTAGINFFLQEQDYLQSRFYFPTDESNGIMDEWTSRFLSYILKPPITGLSIFIVGLLVARLLPRARILAICNISFGSIICLIYISNIFIHCSSVKIAGFNNGKFLSPICSIHCNCKPDVFFSPICPANSKQTYYSPCHAGCSTEFIVNNIAIYQNCTCGGHPDYGIENGLATVGACNSENCQIKWNIFQALTIISTALLGIVKLLTVLISLRTVLNQDRSYALGLEMFLTNLIVYVPGKLLYDFVSDTYCQYWSKDYSRCYLQSSPIHGNILNIISAILAGIAIILNVFVAYFLNELEIVNKYDEELNLQIPLREMNHESYNRIPNSNYDDDDRPPSSINSDAQQLMRNQNLIYQRMNSGGLLDRLNRIENSSTTTDLPPSSPDLSMSSAADQGNRQIVTYAQVIPRKRISNSSEQLDFNLKEIDEKTNEMDNNILKEMDEKIDLIDNKILPNEARSTDELLSTKNLETNF